MKTRTLGPYTVSAIGLGAMPLSFGGSVTPTLDEAVATVHAALDAGITYVDTADIYAPSWDSMGHNEEIVARALATWSGDRDAVVVGTKGGITRSQGEVWGRNGSLDYLRSAVEKSLRVLGVEAIDLYQWHRPDRHRTYAEGVEALATLRDEGKIKAIGVSNASVEELEVAAEVLGEGGLASVQNQFSPKYRNAPDAELAWCGERGIAFLPWAPLGGAGIGVQTLAKDFPAIAEVSADRGVSPQQVVLAWHLAKGEHVIPIPGASRPGSILDSVKAVDLELTDDEFERIDHRPGW